MKKRNKDDKMTKHKNKIMVIKLSALGDFFMAMGGMQAIRRHHPDDEITLLTTKTYKDLAEKCGCFDKIKTVKRVKFYEFSAWIELFKFFNKGNFTRVYDLQNQDRTRFYYHMFLKKPEWAGIIKGTKFFYDNPDWRKIHASKRIEGVLNAAGILDIKMPDLSWMKRDISHLLGGHGIKKPFVIFVPGCSAAHPEKRWPAVRYGGLGLKLVNDGYNIVIIGSKEDEDAMDKVKKACPAAINLCGMTSLEDIYSLALESSGIVGNDTGPCHIASLSHRPMVSLFCSKTSKAAVSSPMGENVKGIEAENIANISVNEVYRIFKPL